MGEITTIGLDLAKSVFQVHAIGADGKIMLRRQVRRSMMLAFFATLAPCLIGMEACAGAHYWARELTRLDHEVRLMPPSYVKPYVKRGKTDAIDAEAICEAVTRPSMRFVSVKTEARQATLMSHRTRDFLVRQLTQLSNAIRAHLGEFGIVPSRAFTTSRDCWLWPRTRHCPSPRASRSCWWPISSAIPTGGSTRSRRRPMRRPRRIRPRAACRYEPGQKTTRGIVFPAIARGSGRSPRVSLPPAYRTWRTSRRPVTSRRRAASTPSARRSG